MSKRSQEKRKARAKEKAKLARRARGESPLNRLVGDAQGVECWSHSAAKDNRMVNLICLRPMRGGGHAAAIFLIDLDCVGLKDAFCRFSISASEMISLSRECAKADGTTLAKTPPEQVRKTLGAAIRWSHDHGFRLPPKLEKSLQVVGGHLDMDTADTAEFGAPGGKLKYVGLRRDLEKLLLHQSIDEFIARPDVDCLFVLPLGDEADADEDFDDEDMDEPDIEAMLDSVESMQKILEQETRKWLTARGIEPHRFLTEAMQLRTIASLKALATGMQEGAMDQALGEALASVEESQRDGMSAASRQIEDFILANKPPANQD